MAAKVPAAAGSHALAGDWTNSYPYFNGSQVYTTAVKAGKLRGPDLVLPFVPASSANDIDNNDTFALLPAGDKRKVVLTAWVSGSATQCLPGYDGDGTYTFSSGNNTSGWLLVWLDSL